MICTTCGHYFNRRRSGGLYCSTECLFWAKVRKTDGCWEWVGATNGRGYGKFFRGRKIKIYAHRFSYFLHTGCEPGHHFVLHKCDNPACVNPEHLFLGSAKDNMDDCIQKGRHRYITRRGEASPCAILTESQVVEILRSHDSYRTLAKTHGVAKSTIGMIKRGINWSHLQYGSTLKL